MSRILAIAGFSTALTACATSDPGWTGRGAQPFEEALAECQQKATVVSERKNREHILEDCMGAKGWHRPRR